ncbi:ring-1,2-phenylacetyl-CoA epoxidase subunit PaaC [Filimonas lacunae]|uniref:Ring-1,2-phenylacetyl-CoA epoxidase subunit PaaC n=1 Tax=Filimonas lacunae TaxID=477680 RepID=A0A173MPH6_9BACT|nr:1,2-phenylacetyl-CoA epoxidase subunit PaaC [Filimonas lacunae]BAV09359.1 phenylacetate-CoA oxygenase, PaaI subunit [Filimonas lacunae]SIS71704.1 ring-1,2-phenylacetyl-CoA epoxidase subunit PaaC [Filimonas lacunae]
MIAQLNNQYFTTLSQPLVQYLLHLADTTLILGHRNSEWCGHGPILEQDIAISNIALDLIGQARMFYQYAAEKAQQPGATDITEDSLAYLRDGIDFKNLLLAEQQNGDWAITILRQFLYSSWQYLVYEQMQQGTDVQMAAIAEKAIKETTYHIKWSGEWVIRLGDGTEESHKRMLHAIEVLWPFTGEMFTPVDFEKEGIQQGWAVDVASLQQPWLQRIQQAFDEAGLSVPQSQWQQTGGKKGVHTELLGFLLAEMQHLQRAYPGSEW